MELTVRVAGEAGQGVATTGEILLATLARMGLHVFSTQSYWSRIRGGLNFYDIRLGDDEFFGPARRVDIMVALTPFALENLRGDVATDGIILFDAEQAPDPGVVALPFSQTASALAGTPIMANSVAAGAVFAVLSYDLEPLVEHLRATFAGKDDDQTAQKNVLCAGKGYELAKAARLPSLKSPQGDSAPSTLYNGSMAIGLAAATAGVKFVIAYPMTPSTATFTYLAHVAEEYGILVEQAEDEIAAVNMACGATYAGVPAMVTTSGGGFALMAEGLSLAGMLELPVFIMDAQRPGPATGLPTRTGQEDLSFVTSAGHGEFARAVFAPGTAAEAYKLTRHALEIAHKYQTPVIMLIDQFLADSRKNIDPLDDTLRPIDRHILADPPADYLRYEVTESGISPRALPGAGPYVVSDSDEHTEDGHITEDLAARVRLQDKRLAKRTGLEADALAPSRYGYDDAEEVIVAWGSTYGPAREAVDILNKAGGSFALVHFSQVFPINGPAARKALLVPEREEAGVRITVVEGNATGQFASLLREGGFIGDCRLVLKYDGMPFTAEEIAERIV